MSKICKKRIYGNDKKNLSWDAEKCPGSLHFTLLTISKKCGINESNFVSNGNTLQRRLCKDSAHLTDVNFFAGNIAHYICHFSLKEFWDDVACSDSHFENLNRDIGKSSSENCSKNKDLNSWSPILNSVLSKFYFV